MKFIFFFIASFLLVFSSCNTETKNTEPTYVPVKIEKEPAPKEDGFYCPMKCEGEKVYKDKSKPCPVCDMKLIPTK